MSLTLSESESKAILSSFGIPFLPEVLVTTEEEASAAAIRFDTPIAAKLCGDNIAHKSERGLVRLNLSGPEDVSAACKELFDAARPEDQSTGVLLAPMAKGLREFIAGTSLDQVFGHTVVFGIGGVLAEAIADVTVRLAPLRSYDAHDMISSLRAQSLFAPFRGEPEVDLESLASILCALSDATESVPNLVSIDLNPIAIVDGSPVALDALIEVTRREEL
ncbi:MAG: acetate--CoA ligase family protein [Acidimicrobiales bacterium]